MAVMWAVIGDRAVAKAAALFGYSFEVTTCDLKERVKNEE